MKNLSKFGLLTILLIGSLLLIGCTTKYKSSDELDQETSKENVIYGEYGSQDITEGKTVYTNKKYGFSLTFGEVYQGGFVHQEDGEDFSTITFFIKDDTDTEEETHIDGYRDVFVVYAIPTEKNDEFMEVIGLTEKDLLGQNEKYILYEKIGEQFEQQKYYTDNIIFPAE